MISLHMATGCLCPAGIDHLLFFQAYSLKSDDRLKAIYLNKPLLEFYRVFVSKEEFSNLRAYVVQWSSVFGSTYPCEQFFSEFTFLHTKTDKNLSIPLRAATSSVRPNIKRLVKQKVSKNLTYVCIGKASFIFD